MKKMLFALGLVSISYSVYSQSMPSQKQSRTKIGLKAGYNWSYATANESGITLKGKSGYMVGAFLAAPHMGIFGFRTEIVYSRQGYSFDNGGRNTEVLNDYIYLPQLSTFSIGKFFQLQIGAQIGYLVNSKKTTANKDSSMLDLMNRFDYGFAGGIELNPIAGLIIGGRYNLGLGKMYKQYQPSTTNPMPFPLPFNPSTTNLKNGVIQIFVGYKF